MSRQRLNDTDVLVLDNAPLCDGDADRVSARRTPCPHEGVACPVALLPCLASMHGVAVLTRGPPGWYAVCMLELSNGSWRGPHYPDAAPGRRQQRGEGAGMRTQSRRGGQQRAPYVGAWSVGSRVFFTTASAVVSRPPPGGGPH